jgi:hypothetical protein
VPKDTYRIRTLNGAALDISPGLDQFSVAAVRKDYRQEVRLLLCRIHVQDTSFIQWEVEPRGNGKCLISMKVSEEEKVYLGWEKGKDGIAQVAASKTPVEWIVKMLSEYTYS